MVVFGGILTNCILVGQYACIKSGSPDAGYFLSTSFFVSGISTVLQVIFGTRLIKRFYSTVLFNFEMKTHFSFRLPLVQGSAIVFIGPTFAFLSLPEWKCSETQVVNGTSGVNNTTSPVTDDWTLRIREVKITVTRTKQRFKNDF